jgi:hypothetical protein
MTKKLTGTAAIVTGASTGIGHATPHEEPWADAHSGSPVGCASWSQGAQWAAAIAYPGPTSATHSTWWVIGKTPTVLSMNANL